MTEDLDLSIQAPLEENSITFSCGAKEMVKLCGNGDIFVKGNLASNDQEIVDTFREFLSYVKENY